ncbi:MAG: hypothetical protein NZ482_01455, partial [Gloeomargarita sp. SKYG98]|nr:hypothetical protein [Gloeomargarita sp. SKYG98]
MAKYWTLAALASVLLAVPVKGQPLTPAEQYLLQSYMGQAYGRFMAGSLGIKSLHVLTNDTSTCAGLTVGLGTGFVDLEGRRPLAVTVLATPTAAQMLNPKEDGVALLFGGQATAEVNAALTRSVLRQLAQDQYPGAIFFHLRVWTPGFVAQAAQEDPLIASYLAAKNNLFAVIPDFDARVVRFWQVGVREGRQVVVQERQTVALNPTWERLLRQKLH